jgi:hypothetical protein
VALEVVARTMAPAEMRRLQAEFEKADIRCVQQLPNTTTLLQHIEVVHYCGMSGSMPVCMQGTAATASITT